MSTTKRKPERTRPEVGTALTARSEEPADGTPLLDDGGRVEPYVSADVGGRWADYVRQLGPFVVAPDFTAVTGRPTRNARRG